jgi:hypothetical protein
MSRFSLRGNFTGTTEVLPVVNVAGTAASLLPGNRTAFASEMGGSLSSLAAELFSNEILEGATLYGLRD